MTQEKSYTIRISDGTAKRLMEFEGKSWAERVRRALDEAEASETYSKMTGPKETDQSRQSQ